MEERESDEGEGMLNPGAVVKGRFESGCGGLVMMAVVVRTQGSGGLAFGCVG